ncbi:MAG: CHAD domain-containing protein [Phycisphaerales bacterium]
MPYRIDPSRPLADEVRRIAGEQLGRALDAIDSSSEDDGVDPVHRVRVCAKRLRAMLRLARAPMGDAFGAENAVVRDVARSLAAARDAQVVLDAFDSLLPADGLTPDLCVLRATLDAQRDLEAAGIEDSRGALAAARPPLEAALARVPDLPVDDLRIDDVWREFASTYRRARRAMRDTLADPAPSHSHEWRSWAKRHWYHVRLMSQASPKAMRERASRLERLTERLGRRHDLDMLRARLTDPDGPLHALEGAEWALVRLDKAAGRLAIRSAREGLRLFSDKPSELARPLASRWARRAAR